MVPGPSHVPASSGRNAGQALGAGGAVGSYGLVVAAALHVAAIFPRYDVLTGHLSSAPDQETLYAVLAASWFLAAVLVLGRRRSVGTGLAVGLAAAEMGFRLYDSAFAVKNGASAVGAGLWTMDAAWVVGAVAAVVLPASLRAPRRPRPLVAPAQVAADDPLYGGPVIDWSSPFDTVGEGTSRPAGETPAEVKESGPPAQVGEESHEEVAADDTAVLGADPTAVVVTDVTDAVAVDLTEAVPTDPTEVAGPGTPTGATGPSAPVPDGALSPEEAQERNMWTGLVAVLALLTAGAFVPAWDHISAFSTVTGRGTGLNSGNAFDVGWQFMIGNAVAMAALALVPTIGIRQRDRGLGAGLAVGSLLVLAATMASAVVQTDQPVSPSTFGLTPAQATGMGLQVGMRLTAWFVVESLAAYALFAVVMIWSTLRVPPDRAAQENSTGIRPNAPDWRSEAIPWAS